MRTIRGLLLVVFSTGVLVLPACGDSSGGDDTGTDADSDNDADSDSDSDTDADTDTDTDSDSDAEGEWCDEVTDLCWQDPPSSPEINWDNAVAYCDDLDWNSHTDWHLPSISELRSLVRGCSTTETGGSCEVADDCLETGCWDASCSVCTAGTGPGLDGCYWDPEMTGDCEYSYWSSSSCTDETGYAWVINFNAGNIDDMDKIPYYSVRCVR